MYVPEGFSTVTPYIFAKNAERFVDFLKRAFDGQEVGMHLRSDGKIANAQVRIGSSTIMISEAVENFPAMPGSYYLYVEDADASVKKAVAQGATQLGPVSDQPYGDRQGGVRDEFGNIWWISQRLIRKPYY